MPRFRCIRKCYVVDRLYKVDDYFEGDAAPTRSFEGYVEGKGIKPVSVAKPAESQAPAQGRGK